MDVRDTRQIDEAADFVEKTRTDLEAIANNHGRGGVDSAERDRLRAARDAAGVLRDRLHDVSRRYGVGSKAPPAPAPVPADLDAVELGDGPVW